VSAGSKHQIESVVRAARLLGEMQSLVSGLRVSVLDEERREESAPLDEGALLETMARIGELSSELRGSLAELAESAGLPSARSRLRHYLLDRPGEVVGTYALSGVAGIQEAPRRLRELREEEGMPITSGPAGGLLPGEYRLERTGAGGPAAQRRRLLDRIRRTAGGAHDRCLSLLRALYPDPAGADDLAYVAGGAEWVSCVDGLVAEGWEVVTATTDPQMREGEYRLASLARRPPRRRSA
jgi:hypothetical protein